MLDVAASVRPSSPGILFLPAARLEIGIDTTDPVARPSPPATADIVVASRLSASRRRYALWASAALCLGSWLLFATQPDLLAWLMIFPRWTWLPAGLVLWLVGISRAWRTTTIAVALLWGIHTVWNVEESRSLLRLMTAGWRVPPADREWLRVVTLNCGSGGDASVEEAFAQDPDLILFQESPTREAIERIAIRHWGKEASVAWGPDAVIAARGPLSLRERSPDGVWIWATWHRPEGDIDVVSLRRRPVPLRFDFWSADCWRDLSQLRTRHRAELADLLKRVEPRASGGRCLIGGDFNAPAHDPTFDALRQSFRDPFDTVGVGWGNTIVNGFPVHRIDQIWATFDFVPIAAAAVPSRHSDHRGVSVDLVPASSN